MNRSLSIARLHLVAWRSYLGWPWGILAIAFATNLAVFGTIGDVPDESFTGGLASIYIVVLIFWGQGITQVFPFAMGLSVTRREFYLATSLVVVAEAFAFSIPLYLLKLVEDATGGWGMSLRFFGIRYLAQDNGLAQILVYAVPFIALSFVGIFCSLVFKRWGLNGIFAMAMAEVAVIGGIVALVTWRGWWAAVGRWLVDQSAVSLIAGWPAMLAAVLASAGFLTIRRAVP